MHAQELDSSGAFSTARPRRVVQVRSLTEDVFELVISRNGFCIRPGQHVSLGIAGADTNREYSVYAMTPETLSFLIKIRKDSVVSRALRASLPGSAIVLSGPFGAFTLAEDALRSKPHVFVATGVGIAPFHAYVTSYPRLDYRLIHGVARLADRYDFRQYATGSYTACVSREAGGDFHGRVTHYIGQHPVDDGGLFYICGNSVMVSDVYDLLRRRGVSSNNLFTEVFY